MKKIASLMMCLVFLLAGTGILPVAGQEEPPPGAPSAGSTVFLPMISSIPAYSIAGQVTDEQGAPLGGVTVNSGNGETALTDANGNYFLRTQNGLYSVSPFLEGIGFAPTALDVSVDGNLGNLDFTGYSGCGDLVANGDFEGDGGWELQNAAFSNARFNSGARSLLLGIVNPAANAASVSTAMTPVIHVPQDAPDAVLRVWLYTQSVTGAAAEPSAIDQPEEVVFGDPVDPNDRQLVQVLDANGAPLKDLLLLKGVNGGQWALVQFNLFEYANNNIRLGFRVSNDGSGAVSAMYVDDVSFQTCPTLLAPEEFIAGTNAPDMPDACTNQVINPGFENRSGWGIPNTAYSAGYQFRTPPETVFAGDWSMRTGIPAYLAYQNRYSYSDAWQTVYIPPGATSARLTLYNKMVSLEAPASGELQTEERNLAEVEPQFAAGALWGEEALAGDRMYILLLNPFNGRIIQTLQAWDARNNNWKLREYDLMAYRGQSIRIQFGTYNDGDYFNRVTSMYVDEAYVEVCGGVLPPPPPPPSSACPAGYSQRLINTSFETSNGWYIPITAYSARYTNLRANSGVRSMLTGIINPWHNRYSYSDFGQPVFIPGFVSDAILRFNVFRQSDDWFGNDRQYLLVLNHWGYWIDTLLWNSSNNVQAWRTIERNVTYLRGQSIRLHFGTYNNGWNGITSMFVDDVTLCTKP